MPQEAMNKLILKGIGKKFYRNWVFRNIDFEFAAGEKVLLYGDNGAGKSTLMRILAGQLSPTEGKIELSINGKLIDYEHFYRHISWSGPYLDLYTDLTLKEGIQMHASLKPLYVSNKEVPQILELKDHQNKLLKHFSSGMLHRVKVGLGILSKSSILLLDEATTNMDEANSKLVIDLMNRFLEDRMLVFASNKPEEFALFEKKLWMGDFVGKKKISKQ